MSRTDNTDPIWIKQERYGIAVHRCHGTNECTLWMNHTTVLRHHAGRCAKLVYENRLCIHDGSGTPSERACRLGTDDFFAGWHHDVDICYRDQSIACACDVTPVAARQRCFYRLRSWMPSVGRQDMYSCLCCEIRRVRMHDPSERRATRQRNMRYTGRIDRDALDNWSD